MAFRRVWAVEAAEVVSRLGWGEAENVPFLMVEDAASAAAGLNIQGGLSSTAELRLQFPGPPAIDVCPAVTATLSFAREMRLARVTCTVEVAEMSAQLAACGMPPIYRYEVWRIEVARLRDRLEPLYRRAEKELRDSGLHAERCRQRHIAEIQAVVSEHELLAAELVQFGEDGYDERCSAVVLSGDAVAGVLLAKIEGDTAADIIRAVSPTCRQHSGLINLLLMMHFTQASLAGGQHFATFVANTHSAFETVNMAKRCGGELLARQFVHRWEIHDD